jgi:hypothetical protein
MIDTQVRIVYRVIFRSSFAFPLQYSQSRVSNIYYTDYGLEQIYEELGKPDIFLLDTAPIFRVLVICSPMIAEQISKPSSQYPYSMPKSWTVTDITPLVGKQSIVSSDVRIDIMLDEIMLKFS